MGEMQQKVPTKRFDLTTKKCQKKPRKRCRTTRKRKESPRDAKGPQHCCQNHFVRANSKSLGVLLLVGAFFVSVLTHFQLEMRDKL